MSSIDHKLILRQAHDALRAYRETKDYEHLVDLYYCTIVLLSEEIHFDMKLAEMIEEDLKLFVIHSN